jgi:hypothetical protein
LNAESVPFRALDNITRLREFLHCSASLGTECLRLARPIRMKHEGAAAKPHPDFSDGSVPSDPEHSMRPRQIHGLDSRPRTKQEPPIEI